MNASPAIRINIAMLRRLSRHRGASLLEGIAYLGIAAIVILGAVSLLSGAFGSALTNRTAEELLALRTNVRKFYMGQSYGAASMNATMGKAGLFPGSLNADPVTGAALNAWKGAVTVTGATGTFDIVYPNIPKDACVTLLLGTTGWTRVAGTAATTVFPITPAIAETMCTNDSNTLTFTSI